MESSNISHVVKIVERKNIVISGIKKIINFDDQEFNLDSIMGNIIVKGTELEMIKLDTIDGNVSIKGNIDSIEYKNSSKKTDSLITKLFKWIK